MRNVSDKSRRENQNTHFTFSNFFFEYHAVYELMWKNSVQRERSQMKIWRMLISRWVPQAVNTHLEYVTLIAFPLQQWSQ